MRFAKTVATADANGYIVGFNAAVKEGYWILADDFGKYYAACKSLEAAKNFK